MRVNAGPRRFGYSGFMSQTALLSADEAQVLSLADAGRASDASIVSKTVLNTPETRVVLFLFSPGQELTTHTSKRRALVHVLSGSCEFLFAGQWQRLEAGALLHLPPNHPHAVRAAFGAFSMLLTLASEVVSAQAS